MLRRFLTLTSLLCASCLLTGCLTTSNAGQRPGVDEARACQKNLQANPTVVKGYVIRACTNNGIWLVDRVDLLTGGMAAQYDFVNGDYAGPETGYSPVPVDSLGEDLVRSYKTLRTTLNHELVSPSKETL